MKTFERICLLVLDSAGVGAMPDAPSFGDAGADTIAHAAASVGGLHLPHLAALGLGHLTHIPGTAPDPAARGAWGKMAEASAGKDTITGHWEMAGLITERPFATFPDGFGPDIIEPFIARTGRGVLGNRPASGTTILEELGAEQVATGQWIVYTSADSVFQIAAHEEVVPLEELYAACEIAREMLAPRNLARVIARPFVGSEGAWKRTYNRRDFTVPPPAPSLCERLTEAGVPVIGLGKIADIFAHRGITTEIHTEGNTDGIARTRAAIADNPRGLIFTNLVDFDMLYGHRRNPEGYAAALQEADEAIPALLDALGPDGLLLITADHGCDPTHEGHTDHTREYVPVLAGSVAMHGGADLGERQTFADLGQTIAENFGVALPSGRSFLGDLPC